MPPLNEPEEIGDEKPDEAKNTGEAAVDKTDVDPLEKVKSLSKAGQFQVGQHAAEIAKQEKLSREADLADFIDQANETLMPFGGKKAHQYLRDDATEYYGDHSIPNMKRAALVHREWGKGGSKNLEKLSDLFNKTKDMPDDVVSDRLKRDYAEFKEEKAKASIKAREIVDPKSKSAPSVNQIWDNADKARTRVLGDRK